MDYFSSNSEMHLVSVSHCPQCKKNYAWAPEDQELDYCEHDFVRLVPGLSSASAAAPIGEGEQVLTRPSLHGAAEPAVASPLHGDLLFGPSAGTDPSAEILQEVGDGERLKAIRSLFKHVLGHSKGRSKDLGKGDTVAAAVGEEVLPRHERENGWHLVGDPISTAAYDRWLVTRTLGNEQPEAQFTRYRVGTFTRHQTYERLVDIESPMMARFHSHGTADLGGGSRASYEIASQPHGEPLTAWLARTEAGPSRGLVLGRAASALLLALRDRDLRPIVLAPDHLWMRDNALQLGTFATLSAASETPLPAFSAELAGSPLMPIPYVAPEILERRVLSHRAEIFSAGQLVAMAVLGEPCDHAAVRDGAVQFSAVGDEVLERLLMGTLWPHPEERWSLDEFVAQISAPHTASRKLPWARLRPGAAGAAFPLGGQDHYFIEDLLLAAREHWDEAIANLPAMLDWLDGTRLASYRPVLRAELQRRVKREDWVLVRLLRYAQPDAPLTWRALALDDAHAERSLAALAQRALGDGPEAIAARAELNRIFESDLRGAFVAGAINTSDKETGQ